MIFTNLGFASAGHTHPVWWAEIDFSKGERRGAFFFLLAPEALGHCDPKFFMIEEEKAFPPRSLPQHIANGVGTLMLSTQIANLSCY